MTDIFKKWERTIASLIDAIQTHKIALPELQRPYVRDRARVRDLFDSLFRGYPTGILLFLENETEQQNKAIGWSETLKRIPQYVVIDGQQRLTWLYAVITWFQVQKESGDLESIIISFNPITGEFKVADAWTKQWQEWIYDIKEVLRWDDLYNFTTSYINNYRERNELTDQTAELEKNIWNNIQTLHNITKQVFITLEIAKSVPIEVVSEIFLRINSKWKALNNSDFILTLMSVYWEDWRKKVETFSNYTRSSNNLIALWADDIVRILIWVGFKRARLEDAYNFLKAQTHEFQNLDNVIQLASNQQNWRNFLTLIKDLWFISSSLITQKTLLVACYVFYLLGINEFKMNFQELNHIIKLYYISMFLSQKYSSASAETILWKDFQILQKVTTKEQFIQFLYDEIEGQVTNDLWNITFPKNIVTSWSRSPLFVVFIAAQIYFQNPILFRTIPISKYFIDLKDKESLGEKTEIDLHHIFPRDYLISLYGAKTIKTTDINQIANKVYAYNSDNKTISNHSPKEYLSFFSKNGEIDWTKNLELNAIPPHFAELSYEDFLNERRGRIIQLIKKYYDHIKDPTAWIIKNDIKTAILTWENHITEFKSSYRWDVAQGQRNDNLKYQIVKTLAAFLNSDWGVLYVWITDEGEILWLENDINLFADKKMDNLLLDIDTLVKTHFSDSYALIKARSELLDWKQIIVFDVQPSSKPIYFSINGKEEFYIRRSASSISLTIAEATSFIRDHFIL